MLIAALALDQYFYGRSVYLNGAGPEPISIRRRVCPKEVLRQRLLALTGEKYRQGAQRLQMLVRRESGLVQAADAIEAETRLWRR